jgi:Astacin (Peptidase family M12A)/Divergent InlB B-repeat domain
VLFLGPASIGVAYNSSLWPKVNGVATVYYIIDAASDPNATSKIQTAISQFNSDFPGLIQWVKWTSSGGPNYVDINLSASNTTGQCEALEGYEAKPAQPMDGSTSCTVGTILHEMGHIIGLWHEQSRSDHGTYINVHYSNSIKGSWSNFETPADNYQDLTSYYDYASLMEYPSFSFTSSGNPVIETIPAGMPLNSSEGVPVPAVADYSGGDKEGIRRLYGAAPTEVTVTSNPVGLKVIVDGTTITTPKSYAWSLNSTHTLDVAAGVQTLAGDIANSTTSATFYYTYGRWNDSTTQSHTITVTPGNSEIAFPSTSPKVATYSANFVQLVPYSAGVSPAGSGQVSVSPQPQSYAGTNGSFFVARQRVTLTATPSSGWSFYEFNNAPFWLPGGLGLEPKSLYVPDTGNPVKTTAEFSDKSVFTIRVTPETFASNLSIDTEAGFAYSWKNFSDLYDSTWIDGSKHTIAYNSPEYPYSSNSRYAFESWSDGGAASHTIIRPGPSTSYVATVTPEFRPATNFNYPPCGGTATLVPASPTGDGFYPTGQQLEFTATPAAGWTFAGWTFDLTGTANPATLTASGETLVFANFNITNTPLTLTGLSPSTISSGSAAFTLTLTGTGFAPGSLVAFNGDYLTPTYVNSTELTVSVPAANVAVPGNYQVFLENFPPKWTGCAVFGYRPFFVAKAS